MDRLLMRLWSEESGQGMAEYGLILALVAVIAIAGFQILGQGVDAQVTKVGETITNPVPAPAPTP
jgi:pilus assembly protein Flp/PilA